jgi:hypothetical protein
MFNCVSDGCIYDYLENFFHGDTVVMSVFLSALAVAVCIALIPIIIVLFAYFCVGVFAVLLYSYSFFWDVYRFVRKKYIGAMKEGE